MHLRFIYTEKIEVFTFPGIIHMESMWNDHGMVNSIWNSSLFPMDSTGFHMESKHIHHGFHGKVHMDSMEWSIWIITIPVVIVSLQSLSKNKIYNVGELTLNHSNIGSTLPNWATQALLHCKLKHHISHPWHVAPKCGNCGSNIASVVMAQLPLAPCIQGLGSNISCI